MEEDTIDDMDWEVPLLNEIMSVAVKLEEYLCHRL